MCYLQSIIFSFHVNFLGYNHFVVNHTISVPAHLPPWYPTNPQHYFSCRKASRRPGAFAQWTSAFGWDVTVDGRNPKQPPEMKKNLVNQWGNLSINWLYRRISEPINCWWFPSLLFWNFHTSYFPKLSQRLDDENSTPWKINDWNLQPSTI